MPEQAPMLRVVWGGLADRVAGLVRAHPVLAQRLVFAPRRAMHAYAAALHEAGTIGSESEAVLAKRLASTHPRVLLVRAMPGCSARMYGLLDRAGETARPAAFYRRVHALLAGDLAPILWEATSIDDHVLAFADALSAMDPLVVRGARRALDHSATRAQALQDMLCLFDDHGIAVADLADSLSEHTGSKALAKSVRRLIDRLTLPNPGFALPAGLRFVATIGQLRAVGKQFNNCLSGAASRYDKGWLDALRGQRVYIVRDDDPPWIACLCHASEGWWWLEQASGRANAILPTEVQAGLERDLADAGVQLLHGDPHRALWRLLDLPCNPDDDEMDEDDGVDLAA